VRLVSDEQRANRSRLRSLVRCGRFSTVVWNHSFPGGSAPSPSSFSSARNNAGSSLSTSGVRFICSDLKCASSWRRTSSWVRTRRTGSVFASAFGAFASSVSGSQHPSLTSSQ
jgi:hypothetical protein